MAKKGEAIATLNITELEEFFTVFKGADLELCIEAGRIRGFGIDPSHIEALFADITASTTGEVSDNHIKISADAALKVLETLHKAHKAKAVVQLKVLSTEPPEEDPDKPTPLPASTGVSLRVERGDWTELESNGFARDDAFRRNLERVRDSIFKDGKVTAEVSIERLERFCRHARIESILVHLFIYGGELYGAYEGNTKSATRLSTVVSGDTTEGGLTGLPQEYLAEAARLIPCETVTISLAPSGDRPAMVEAECRVKAEVIHTTRLVAPRIEDPAPTIQKFKEIIEQPLPEGTETAIAPKDALVALFNLTDSARLGFVDGRLRVEGVAPDHISMGKGEVDLADCTGDAWSDEGAMPGDALGALRLFRKGESVAIGIETVGKGKGNVYLGDGAGLWHMIPHGAGMETRFPKLDPPARATMDLKLTTEISKGARLQVFIFLKDGALFAVNDNQMEASVPPVRIGNVLEAGEGFYYSMYPAHNLDYLARTPCTTAEVSFGTDYPMLFSLDCSAEGHLFSVQYLVAPRIEEGGMDDRMKAAVTAADAGAAPPPAPKKKRTKAPTPEPPVPAGVEEVEPVPAEPAPEQPEPEAEESDEAEEEVDEEAESGALAKKERVSMSAFFDREDDKAITFEIRGVPGWGVIRGVFGDPTTTEFGYTVLQDGAPGAPMTPREKRIHVWARDVLTIDGQDMGERYPQLAKDEGDDTGEVIDEADDDVQDDAVDDAEPEVPFQPPAPPPPPPLAELRTVYRASDLTPEERGQVIAWLHQMGLWSDVTDVEYRAGRLDLPGFTTEYPEPEGDTPTRTEFVQHWEQLTPLHREWAAIASELPLALAGRTGRSSVHEIDPLSQNLLMRHWKSWWNYTPSLSIPMRPQPHGAPGEMAQPRPPIRFGAVGLPESIYSLRQSTPPALPLPPPPPRAFRPSSMPTVPSREPLSAPAPEPEGRPEPEEDLEGAIMDAIRTEGTELLSTVQFPAGAALSPAERRNLLQGAVVQRSQELTSQMVEEARSTAGFLRPASARDMSEQARSRFRYVPVGGFTYIYKEGHGPTKDQVVRWNILSEQVARLDEIANELLFFASGPGQHVPDGKLIARGRWLRSLGLLDPSEDLYLDAVISFFQAHPGEEGGYMDERGEIITYTELQRLRDRDRLTPPPSVGPPPPRRQGTPPPSMAPPPGPEPVIAPPFRAPPRVEPAIVEDPGPPEDMLVPDEPRRARSAWERVQDDMDYAMDLVDKAEARLTQGEIRDWMDHLQQYPSGRLRGQLAWLIRYSPDFADSVEKL